MFTLVCVAATAILAAIVALWITRVRDQTQSQRIQALVKYTNGLLERESYDPSGFDGASDVDALERSLSHLAGDIRGVVEQLKIEASQREAILSSLGEGVLAVDKDLRVVFCNEAMLKAVGARHAVRDRAPLLELIRDSEILAMLAEVIGSAAPSRRSLRVGPARGRSFEIYAAPFEADSGRGAIAIFHDITDLERLEQVRKDFVANVSHEMRTPLASIIAYSDTLLEGALEEPQVNRKFIEVIRSNAVRLNNIAADLLILSELESGAAPGQLERVSAREVLETALRTIEPEARANNVRIMPPVIEELYVMGHRFRLEQALLNLLANAVKFNRPDGTVHAGVHQGEDGSVLIEVSDTGIGIPSQDLPRIFERFYRVDKARSRQVGGTGLGLSIARHVIEGMGGSIQVESQLGKGSRFIITLPAAPPT